MSIGSTVSTRSPPRTRTRRSLASVSGSQDTYAVRLGAHRATASSTSGWQPTRGGVEDHRIGPAVQVAQHVFGLAFEEEQVVDSQGVEGGVLYRCLRLLDGDHPLDIGRQQHRKGAHPGVGVHQGLDARQLQSFAQQEDQLLGLLGVHLEEGGRRDAEDLI